MKLRAISSRDGWHLFDDETLCWHRDADGERKVWSSEAEALASLSERKELGTESPLDLHGQIWQWLRRRENSRATIGDACKHFGLSPLAYMAVRDNTKQG
jgi:hypothetical protein